MSVKSVIKAQNARLIVLPSAMQAQGRSKTTQDDKGLVHQFKPPSIASLLYKIAEATHIRI